MGEVKLQNESALDKEAALFNPAFRDYLRVNRVGKSVGDLFDHFRSSEPAAAKAAKEGKFVTNPTEEMGMHGTQYRWYDQDEINRHRRKSIEEDGNGFVGDAALGLANLVTPKSWGVKEKTQNALTSMKLGLENIDTKAGSFLAGKDNTSLRGKLFSVKAGHKGEGYRVGETTNADGTVEPLMRGTGVDRRPSVLAPAQNAAALATPLLASAFLAEKLYPDQHGQQPGSPAILSLQPNEQNIPKVAQESYTNDEKTGILGEGDIAWRMDKEASMTKIAMLEEALEKHAAELKDVRHELSLMEKQANWERQEKTKLQQVVHEKDDELLNKMAEAEEFRLRTIARDRSASAVKLAEEMLELGMIKQAHFDSRVDSLMECDENTLNLWSSIVKEASNGKEGLETSAVLSDYSINDMDSTSLRPERGMSKSGQTIGQAARDLIPSDKY